MDSIRSAIQGFLDWAKRTPEQTAVEADGESFTYARLAERSIRIARSIQTSQPLVALLAVRSVGAYAALAGVLIARRGYVPLNPEFPLERTRAMLKISEADTILVTKECWSQLKDLLAEWLTPLTIVLIDQFSVGDWPTAFAQHRFVLVAEDPPAWPDEIKVTAQDLAYVLFTSGSTGVPKGVAITHFNLSSYVRNILTLYPLSSADRFSQVHGLTFDPSVHDIFSAWAVGATLCSLPQSSILNPARYIRDQRISVWFSVPSVAARMQRMRMLAPGVFPSLRLSLFCGEPLAAGIAAAWQAAAANSVVENLYGPTEATVAIAHYRWQSHSDRECMNEIVPLGEPFPNQHMKIVDPYDNLCEQGELCLAGSQVSSGYWRDAERTKTQFHGSWYRTGDVVERRDGRLHFRGRLDEQVKIRGHRVELLDVESHLKQILSTDRVAVVVWPRSEGRAEGLVAFVAGAIQDSNLLEKCQRVLPAHMVPTQFYYVDDIPRTANGKIDRPRLLERLERG